MENTADRASSAARRNPRRGLLIIRSLLAQDRDHNWGQVGQGRSAAVGGPLGPSFPFMKVILYGLSGSLDV